MAYPYYQYPIYNQAAFQQLQNMQQAQQNQQPQIQTNGIITVRSIEEARSYPVAPGNSLTFKHESAPYIYTKTLGFSQLDQPIFEVFRLEKEQDVEAPRIALEESAVQFLTIDEGNALKTDIEALKQDIQFLKDYIEDDKKEEVKDV